MISLIATTVAIWLVWIVFARSAAATKGRRWRNALVAVAAVVIAVAAWPGGMVLRKTLVQLAMPCGVVWLLLAGLALAAWHARHRRLAASIAAAWVLFSLAGNAWVAGAMFAWLEGEYAPIVPLEKGPFEAVVVLGGGTSTAPNREPQLSAGGDRVRLGAALYLAGRAPHLICTGTRIAGVSRNPNDPAEEVARLWQQLGVPRERITQLPGRTTSEEMIALRRFLEQRNWRRVGLVTSAAHMRRALRLAHREGLRLDPLPADFVTQPSAFNGLSIIPDGATLLRTHLGCKEILAGWLGQ